MGERKREVSHEGTNGPGLIRLVQTTASRSLRYGKKFERGFLTRKGKVNAAGTRNSVT